MTMHINHPQLPDLIFSTQFCHFCAPTNKNEVCTAMRSEQRIEERSPELIKKSLERCKQTSDETKLFYKNSCNGA